MSAYYPLFLDLRRRLCVVVGGGAPAARRVEGLLAAGARVRVIAPRLGPALSRRAAGGEIEHRARRYRDGDLAAAALAFSERLGEATHRALAAEAARRNLPLNVEDELRYCSFIVPAVVREGDLVVAISTGGKAPALAVRLKEALRRQLGAQHARFLTLAGRLRAPLLRRHPDFATRKALWYRLVDSDVLERLAAGDEAGARARVASIMGVAPETAASAAEVAS